MGDPGTLVAAARRAIVRCTGGRLPPLVDETPIDGDPVAMVAARIAEHLGEGRGVWVAAGEVGVALPAGAPPGGRARHLAACVAEALARRALRRPWALLCAASDGRDGSGAAGVALDHRTPLDRRALGAAIADFGTGAYFRRLGVELPEFPPRTNLTDLYLAVAA